MKRACKVQQLDNDTVRDAVFDTTLKSTLEHVVSKALSGVPTSVLICYKDKATKRETDGLLKNWSEEVKNRLADHSVLFESPSHYEERIVINDVPIRLYKTWPAGPIPEGTFDSALVGDADTLRFFGELHRKVQEVVSTEANGEEASSVLLSLHTMPWRVGEGQVNFCGFILDGEQTGCPKCFGVGKVFIQTGFFVQQSLCPLCR